MKGASSRPRFNGTGFEVVGIGPVRKLVFDPAMRDFVEQDVGRKFVGARIPFAWLWRANRLPGRASAVAISLWFVAGVRRSHTFKLTAEAADLAGCGRKALYASLRALEAAGLISVERRAGARPLIALLPGSNADTVRAGNTGREAR